MLTLTVLSGPLGRDAGGAADWTRREDGTRLCQARCVRRTDVEHNNDRTSQAVRPGPGMGHRHTEAPGNGQSQGKTCTAALARALARAGLCRRLLSRQGQEPTTLSATCVRNERACSDDAPAAAVPCVAAQPQAVVRKPRCRAYPTAGRWSCGKHPAGWPPATR